jgi:hypothetical protein
MQSILPLVLLAASVPSFASAQVRPHASTRPAASRSAAQAPKSIGKFDDWQAATHQEAGQLVCYAFTRATASQPSIPGRGDVVLTVTQRTGGRDAVAISAGFAYPPSTEVQVGVDASQMPFYTANRSAFARDGKVAVGAFGKGRQAVALSPGPRNIQVSDTFSLRGFNPAYAAINKACPAK